MARRDGRSLDHKALEVIRLEAVRRVREDGASPEAVIQVLGFHRSCIYDWLSRFDKGGYEALKARPVPGAKPLLEEQQRAWLLKTMRDRTPLDFGFEVALWTRRILREVIERELGHRVTEATVGRWLREVGVGVQRRPLRVTYDWEMEAMEAWRQKALPTIRREARRVGAKLYFGDMAPACRDHDAGCGGRPVPEVQPRVALHMISAVSPRGKVRFMLHEGAIDGGAYRVFLDRLLEGMGRSVYLVVDGRHPLYREPDTRAFLEDRQERLKLFFLSRYPADSDTEKLM